MTKDQIDEEQARIAYEQQLQQDMMMQQQMGNYLPRMDKKIDDIMSKHLDASIMLKKMKMMMLGLEQDEKSKEWKPKMVFKGYDENGKEVFERQPPLMPTEKIDLLFTSLGSYLSSNTFLSEVDEYSRNDIMWGICQNLAILFFRLGKRISPEERAWFGSTIKDSIYFAISRAGNKITLDAVSKTQQTIEHAHSGVDGPPGSKKDFKVFGGW